MNPIQQAAQGLRILRDWLGKDGKTVPIEHAEKRSQACVNCPHNFKGSWMWNIATSLAIASQLRLRQTMGLVLSKESDLKVCEKCGCQIRLKVHVPFEHIYRHTSDDQFAKYPAECWQKQEYNEWKNRNADQSSGT